MSILGITTISSLFSMWLKNIVEVYNNYMNNLELINSSNNLSIYQNKESHYMTQIRKFMVFKKSNFKINSYYWTVKTKDSLYYYTTTDNEMETLSNILKTTKLSEFRGKCIDHFFEYCLVSYITNENVQLMRRLSKGETGYLQDGVCVRTQEYFELLNEEIEMDTSYKKRGTPDLFIEYNGNSFIIDSYNGTNEKEIRKKINFYKSRFENVVVYIFSSGVSTLEQFTAKITPTFMFFGLEGEKLAVIQKIKCGPIVLDIDLLRKQYFTEYRIFKSEIYYWLCCEQEGAILKTNRFEKCC